MVLGFRRKRTAEVLVDTLGGMGLSRLRSVG